MKCDKCGRDFDVDTGGITYKWMAGNLQSSQFLGDHTRSTFTDIIPIMTGACIECYNEWAAVKKAERQKRAKRGLRNGLIILVSSIPIAFFSEELAGVVGFVGLLLSLLNLWWLFMPNFKPGKDEKQYMLRPFATDKARKSGRKSVWNEEQFKGLKQVNT